MGNRLTHSQCMEGMLYSTNKANVKFHHQLDSHFLSTLQSEHSVHCSFKLLTPLAIW